MRSSSTVKAALLGGAMALGMSVAQAGPEDNSLVVSMADALEAVDFYLHQQRAIRTLQPLVEDSLFAYDPATGNVNPSLASDYEIVDDLTIDVTLREGVVFHDGSPFTADDVVYSFEAGMQPAMSQTTLQQRVGPWLESVEKTGDMSVRLHLSSPHPFALLDIANHWVIRKEGSLPEDGIPQEEINGLGPYRLVSWDGQEVVLARFEGYFEGGPKSGATIDTIRIRAIPDVGTVQAEMLSGGIDLAIDVPLDVAQNMATREGIDHRSTQTDGVVYIAMDPSETLAGEPNPLADPLVRRGFNHAINKQSLIDNLFGGIPAKIHTPCHPQQFGCTTDVPAYEYDPERARELFAEAGYEDGLPLDVWAGRDRPMVEAVANDLIQAGAEVNLRFTNMAAVEAARADGRVPFIINDWGNTANPDIWATLINYFGQESDRSLVKNDDELEALIQAIPETTTADAREAAFHEAVRYIAEQAYWVPLMTVSMHFLTDSDLEFEPTNPPLLYEASWQ